MLDFEVDAPKISNLVHVGHGLLSLVHLLPTIFCLVVLFSHSSSCGDSLVHPHAPCIGAETLLMLLLTLIPLSMFCGMVYIATVGAWGGASASQERVWPSLMDGQSRSSA